MDKVIIGISEASEQQFGGKINRLSEAIKKGLKVPIGFAVGANIIKEITIGSYDIMEQRINDMTVDILHQFSLYNISSLIVRTSSLLEDRMFDSNAGVSFSQRCKSDFLELAYTLKNVIKQNFSNYLFDFGLLIQEVPDIFASGVAFSGFPDSKKNIIEGVFFSGEDVTSGKNIDFRFSFPKKKLENPHYYKPYFKICQEFTKNYNQYEERIATEVSRLIDFIARDMNFSPDIEWVIDTLGLIYLVQIRPITTMETIPSEEIILQHYIEIILHK